MAPPSLLVENDLLSILEWYERLFTDFIRDFLKLFISDPPHDQFYLLLEPTFKVLNNIYQVSCLTI